MKKVVLKSQILAKVATIAITITITIAIATAHVNAYGGRQVQLELQNRRSRAAAGADGRALCLAGFLAAAGEAETSLDLRRHLRAALAGDGYETFQLLRFVRRQLAEVTWSEMPASGSCLRSSDAWLPALPLLAQVLESGCPLSWRVAPDSARKLTGPQSPHENFLEMARKYGFCHGVVIPVQASNAAADVLIVSRATPDRPERERTWTLAAMAYVVCSRLRQIDRASRPAATSAEDLSARECEVLHWCKDGKSYSEVGTILGISSKTVEFHMANIMRKLGVHQKIAAIVAAARRGLIEL